MKYKKIKKIMCKQKIPYKYKQPISKKQYQLMCKLQKQEINNKTKNQLNPQLIEVSKNQEFQTFKQYKRQKIYLKQLFQTLHNDSFNSQKNKNQQLQLLNSLQNIYKKISQMDLQDHCTIDMLLNRQKGHIWPIEENYFDLSLYIKYLNYCLQKQGRNIIIRTEGGALCLSPQNEWRQENTKYMIEHISFIESLILQNRMFFMEKIQVNQKKYPSHSMKLSQISKEILYLFKLQQNNQEITVSNIKEIREKIPAKFQMARLNNYQQKHPIKTYYQILIKKNIRHAFNEQLIQRFNYFKANQIRERPLDSCFYNYKNIQDQQQLCNYLKKKKPKKGKSSKYCLPTACSVCFSDYYQVSNPFTSCDNCFHRCHKLCFDLASQKCGYCSYQHITKQEKKSVLFCQICKKKDQMCIKLNQKTYCHGFCLLVHNFWRISPSHTTLEPSKNRKTIKQQKSEVQIQLQKTCMDIQNPNHLNPIIEKRMNNIKNIDQQQYEHKKQNNPLNLNAKLYSNSQQKQDKNNNHHQNINGKLNLKECQNQNDILTFKIQYLPIRIHQNSQEKKYLSLEQQVIIPNHKQSMEQNRFHNFQDSERQKQELGCKICNENFIGNLFLKCLCCNKKYHAFCAFFEGYQFNFNLNLTEVVIQKCKTAQTSTFQQNLAKNSHHSIEKPSVNVNVNININLSSLQNFQATHTIQILKQKRSFILNENGVVFKNLL